VTDTATITVNIMGTFSEKLRPNNGLERVARYLNENRLSHVPIVAEIGFHKNSETLDGHVLTIKLLATEPGVEADGSDPHGHGKQIRDLLDSIRKQAGKGAFEETLFSVPREGFNFDEPEGGSGGNVEGGSGGNEVDGQQQMRIGPDGPRVVPPPSGEEVLAARAEAKAAKLGAKPGAKSAKPTADPFTPDGAA
jgi:hypothetical protein